MPGTGDHVEKRGFNPRQAPKSQRRSYDSKFKLAVIAAAKETSTKAAARKFDVESKQVREWRKQENKLKGAHATRKSFRGPKAGKFPQVEAGVVDFWRKARSQLCSVSRRMMVREAIKIARSQGIMNLKCSLGWIRRMMKRNGLAVRRRTTIAQRLPMEYEEKLLSFQRHVVALRKRNSYLLGHIGNDQTPLYLDMPSRTTVEKVGTKSIQVKTTGNEHVKGDQDGPSCYSGRDDEFAPAPGCICQ
ncbi:Pogo transposable element with KRAB domain [Frankliniella fusca]|uniref:Pogo transposable element with KRAB domain n=1 Tax=Frankliniella fusca TaxID=407009 RepID=A0AAE1GXP3_9NEOP|nr:Pogo transposable element with KRAB domain [Frankliniella fusca]